MKLQKSYSSLLSLSNDTTLLRRWIVLLGIGFMIVSHLYPNDQRATLLPTCNALKHHIRIKNGYNLIGPLGEPFSFLEKGHYEINLYDYYMYTKQSLIAKKRGYKNSKSLDTDLTNYNGGFYLQRFTNEGEYFDYINILRSNRTLCSYEYFLDNTDDTIAAIDDTYDYSGIEQPDASNGILLNVKSDHFTKSSSSPTTPEDLQHVTTTIHYTFKKGEEGLYFLMYQVCPYNPNILSSFHIDFHFYNYDALGNKSYLSAGEVHLPVMYFFFTVSYILCFAIWFLNILEILRGREGLFVPKGGAAVGRQSSTSSTSRPVVYTIHYLMALLLIVKILSVFFEGVRYYKIQVTGHAEILSVMYYIFTFIKGMFLFTVLLLIGTGWSFIKSSLNPKEKKIITIVLMLQFINNIAIAIASQETIGEKWYGRWTAVMHLIDIICCCAIIIPIVWQVDELEKSVGITSEYDENGQIIINTNTTRSSESTIAATAEVGEKELALERLRTFRLFYMLVIAYVYSTRILVYLFVSILNYKHIWIQQLVIELVTLTFYVTVGFMFRPQPDPTRSTSLNGTPRSNNNSIGNYEEEQVELISHK